MTIGERIALDDAEDILLDTLWSNLDGFSSEGLETIVRAIAHIHARRSGNGYKHGK